MSRFGKDLNQSGNRLRRQFQMLSCLGRPTKSFIHSNQFQAILQVQVASSASWLGTGNDCRACFSYRFQYGEPEKICRENRAAKTKPRGKNTCVRTSHEHAGHTRGIFNFV